MSQSSTTMEVSSVQLPRSDFDAQPITRWELTEYHGASVLHRRPRPFGSGVAATFKGQPVALLTAAWMYGNEFAGIR